MYFGIIRVVKGNGEKQSKEYDGYTENGVFFFSWKILLIPCLYVVNSV